MTRRHSATPITAQSGPETGCSPWTATTPEPWTDVSATAVRLAAQDAIAREQRGSLSTSVVDVAGVASVRSKLGAVRPVPVDFVSFHTESGAVGGILLVLPVHPTVLPASSTVISADLTGAVRRAVSAPWVVVATGAAGDISTRGVRRASDPDECAREPFLDLRSRTDNALLLGYVGGYVGYLPTREAFAGEPTYVDIGMELMTRLA